MSKHGMSSQLARAKKKSGHAEENKFNAYFSEDSITSDSSNMNHSGASADCKVTVQSYKNKISDNLENITDFSVSLKSGKTIQIHLGIIPELSKKDLVKKNKKLIKEKILTCIEHNINFEEQKKHLQSYEFWNKYLGKGGLLCYSDKKGKYDIF